jgi:hypothetical protein
MFIKKKIKYKIKRKEKENKNKIKIKRGLRPKGLEPLSNPL